MSCGCFGIWQVIKSYITVSKWFLLKLPSDICVDVRSSDHQNSHCDFISIYNILYVVLISISTSLYIINIYKIWNKQSLLPCYESSQCALEGQRGVLWVLFLYLPWNGKAILFFLSPFCPSQEALTLDLCVGVVYGSKFWGSLQTSDTVNANVRRKSLAPKLWWK